MNKYVIKQDATGVTGSALNVSTSTGKIVLNNVEITNIDTFNKAVDTFKDLQQQIEEKDKEIDRLNNIIDELEKYTIEQRDIAKDNMEIIGNEGKRMATRFVVYNEYLDKLKSLKEGKQ